MPYIYSWSNGDTDSLNTGLTAGTYILTVTDGLGCVFIDSIIITEPLILLLTTTDLDVLCFGGNTGSSTVHVTGGTTNYSYSWSPSGGSDSTALSLVAGTYTVIVTDALGCIDSITTIINEPALLTTSLTQSEVSCSGGSDGEVVVIPLGGTLPYTYLWSNADTDSIADNVFAGPYSVTVTDSNGCTSIANTTVTEPSQLVSNINNSVNVSCNGGSDGSATVSTSGGTTPYSYLWSTGGINATETNLIAGTYTVTTTDSLGCTDLDTIVITEPLAPLTAITTSIDNPCFGDNLGSGEVTASGGTTPYSYLWSPVANVNDSINGLAAGTYYVTVTDTLGCIVTDSITINEPTILALSFTQSNVSCNGGTEGEGVVTP